jgi:hypothetical protein
MAARRGCHSTVPRRRVCSGCHPGSAIAVHTSSREYRSRLVRRRILSSRSRVAAACHFAWRIAGHRGAHRDRTWQRSRYCRRFLAGAGIGLRITDRRCRRRSAACAGRPRHLPGRGKSYVRCTAGREPGRRPRGARRIRGVSARSSGPGRLSHRQRTQVRTHQARGRGTDRPSHGHGARIPDPGARIASRERLEHGLSPGRVAGSERREPRGWR